MLGLRKKKPQKAVSKKPSKAAVSNNTVSKQSSLRTTEAIIQRLELSPEIKPKPSNLWDEFTPLEKEHFHKILRHKAVSHNELTRIVHEEWGKYTSVSRIALAKRISRYYNSHIKPEAELIEEISNDAELHDALTKVRPGLPGGFDVVSELGDLYSKQKYLYDKQFESVKDLSNPDVRKCNSTLKEIASILRLAINTYMDMGLIERKPKRSQVHVHSTSDKETLTFESQVEKQRELEDGTKKILELVRDVDGKYKDIGDKPRLLDSS